MRLRCRSVVVLQRWWRWSVCMKHRLNFLSSLRKSLHALGGGKILMAERQTLENLDLDRAESSSQLLLETKCEPAAAKELGPRILLNAVKFDMMCNRRKVPKWVNFESKEVPESGAGGTAASAAAADKRDNACRQPLTLLHARVRAQPRHHHRDTPSCRARARR